MLLMSSYSHSNPYPALRQQMCSNCCIHFQTEQVECIFLNWICQPNKWQGLIRLVVIMLQNYSLIMQWYYIYTYTWQRIHQGLTWGATAAGPKIIPMVLVSLHVVVAGHIHQGYFSGTGAIMWLPQCLRSNPEEYAYKRDYMEVLLGCKD